MTARQRILIVGGTSFVGRAVAWSAWHHGHDVTVINRGVTPSDLPDTVTHLVGDRQGDLSALFDQHFDATIDAIAYRPSDVERLYEALGERAGHYVQISSVSAYGLDVPAGANEMTAPLVSDEGLDFDSPITGATYGPLKAAAERAGARLWGDVATFVRPTYVIGSHDVTLRFPYWVERARRGGVVAVPGPRSSPMQYVDARDLANFVVRVVEDQLGGAFHVAGPEPGDHFVEMVEQIVAHVGPPGSTVHVVEPSLVERAGLENKFPLWSGLEAHGVMTLDCRHALSHGLDLRPLPDSVDDVREWWGDRGWPPHWLSADEESRLLSL